MVTSECNGHPYSFQCELTNATISYKGNDSRMVLTTFLSRLGCDMLLYHPIQNKNIETLKYSKPRGIPTCLWAHQLAKIGYYIHSFNPSKQNHIITKEPIVSHQQHSHIYLRLTEQGNTIFRELQ